MRRVLLLTLAGVLLSAASCGSDDGDGGASSADVERSLKADLSSGERVVDLGASPPKLVECEQDGKSWRCRVTAASGRSIVCVVQAEPESGKTVRRVCAPVDN